MLERPSEAFPDFEQIRYDVSNHSAQLNLGILCSILLSYVDNISTACISQDPTGINRLRPISERTLEDLRRGRQRAFDEVDPIADPSRNSVVVEVVIWMMQRRAVAVTHQYESARPGLEHVGKVL